MGLQLIFVVETNKKSKSDWIYVKDTVDYFYKYERTEVKFSPIYMEGRGKYNSPKKQREIEQKISQYSVHQKIIIQKLSIVLIVINRIVRKMTENFWKKLRNTVKSMNMNLCGFVKM